MCIRDSIYIVLRIKQKTAYEIASGDWSSDVCSSDLSRSFFRTYGFLSAMLLAIVLGCVLGALWPGATCLAPDVYKRQEQSCRGHGRARLQAHRYRGAGKNNAGDHPPIL